MDQAEAKAIGLEFKDIMALESSGMDIAVLKKMITGLIDGAQVKLEKTIKDEYDKKIKGIDNGMAKMMGKIQPVVDLT